MITIHFETLGCKLNQIESESMASSFFEAGFTVQRAENSTLNSSPDSVALCIVNTCTVTGKAEQKARRIIRVILKKYPMADILVTGCYAQVDAASLASIDNRVFVVPGGIRGKIAELPQFIIQTVGKKILTADQFLEAFHKWPHLWKPAEPLPGFDSPFNLAADDFFFHSRASIKIQDGCNNKCSYCRICIARGPSVSLNADSVVERLRSIESRGWNEAVLTGVNLSQYRSGEIDFAGLLKRILAETEHIQLRISSLYPERVDDELLPILADPRICPHFHLSIQSGSSRILRSMCRVSNVDRIYNAIEKLRQVKDNPFIACDIITGFPGETEDDFQQTLSLCKNARFAGIHAFPFSPRPGTVAWNMKPRVPERVAGERVAELLRLAESSRQEYVNQWKNRKVDAILEQSDQHNDFSTAVTSNYLQLLLPNNQLIQNIASGSRIMVTIGEVISREPGNLSDADAKGTFCGVTNMHSNKNSSLLL